MAGASNVDGHDTRHPSLGAFSPVRALACSPWHGSMLVGVAECHCVLILTPQAVIPAQAGIQFYCGCPRQKPVGRRFLSELKPEWPVFERFGLAPGKHVRYIPNEEGVIGKPLSQLCVPGPADGRGANGPNAQRMGSPSCNPPADMNVTVLDRRFPDPSLESRKGRFLDSGLRRNDGLCGAPKVD